MSNSKHLPEGPTPRPNPKIPIYLTGQMPAPGSYGVCATCAMIYMGTVSAENEFHEYVRELHWRAEDNGQEFLTIDLPEREDLMIQPAMTVAPSTYFPTAPMPVCWTHIQGYREPTPEEKEKARQQQQPQQPGIIPGKAFGRGWQG